MYRKNQHLELLRKKKPWQSLRDKIYHDQSVGMCSNKTINMTKSPWMILALLVLWINSLYCHYNG